MATHSSILAQRILWTEEPGQATRIWGHKESDTTEPVHTHYPQFQMSTGGIRMYPVQMWEDCCIPETPGELVPWMLLKWTEKERSASTFLHPSNFFSICHQQNLAENQLTQEPGKNILQERVPLIAQSKQKSEEGI